MSAPTGGGSKVGGGDVGEGKGIRGRGAGAVYADRDAGTPSGRVIAPQKLAGRHAGWLGLPKIGGIHSNSLSMREPRRAAAADLPSQLGPLGHIVSLLLQNNFLPNFPQPQAAWQRETP